MPALGKASVRPLAEDFHDGTGSLWLGESTKILTESISQRLVAQELDERGSQGVGGGRGGFGHEGGGVVGEQAGVETLVVVSRGRDATWALNYRCSAGVSASGQVGVKHQ